MFKRNIENFVCEKCGAEIEGNGYTNHCPECLWSKHVDVFPGDRALLRQGSEGAQQGCEGMMEPIRVEKKGKEYTIIHKCQKCGFEKPNKAVKEDSFQMLVQISAEVGNK